MLAKIITVILLPAIASVSSAAITATLTPYQLDQCNLGTAATQEDSIITDGVCSTFSPEDLAYIPGYQSFRAHLNDPTEAEGKNCYLNFYASNGCGNLGEGSNAIQVPTDPKECEPINLDLLGNVVGQGCRAVMMKCE